MTLTIMALGIMTLIILTLGIMILTIMILNETLFNCNAGSAPVLTVIRMNVIMLIAFTPYVILQSAVILSTIMLENILILEKTCFQKKNHGYY